jgi:hypothetical protein
MLFKDPQAWKTGGDYEVCFQLRTTQLELAWRTIWCHPRLVGPWAKIEDIGASMALAHAEVFTDYSTHYGLLRLDDETLVAATTVVVPVGKAEFVDLVLGLPLVWLSRQFTVHYPTHTKCNTWRTAIDAALINVAEAVYRNTPFELAGLGECAGAMLPDLQTKPDDSTPLLLSEETSNIWQMTHGQRLPSGLYWFPGRDWD